MTTEEWRELAQDINTDIAGMTRARAVRDRVKSEMSLKAANRGEEQFIDDDAFGVDSCGPRKWTLDGIVIEVTKLHRNGLKSSDVLGADLFYEIEGKKFVLIQYKSPSKNGRVQCDHNQLTKLREACPVKCLPTQRRKCGAWYAIRSDSGGVYFPACEADAIFDSHDSRTTNHFNGGLTTEDFQDEFRICHIGGRTDPIDIPSFTEASLAADRLFIKVNRHVGESSA